MGPIYESSDFIVKKNVLQKGGKTNTLRNEKERKGNMNTFMFFKTR